MIHCPSFPWYVFRKLIQIKISRQYSNRYNCYLQIVNSNCIYYIIAECLNWSFLNWSCFFMSFMRFFKMFFKKCMCLQRPYEYLLFMKCIYNNFFKKLFQVQNFLWNHILHEDRPWLRILFEVEHLWRNKWNILCTLSCAFSEPKVKNLQMVLKKVGGKESFISFRNKIVP